MSSRSVAFIKETLVSARFLAYHRSLAFVGTVSVFDHKSSLMISSTLNCGATPWYGMLTENVAGTLRVPSVRTRHHHTYSKKLPR